jgi:hypothetical protein
MGFTLRSRRGRMTALTAALTATVTVLTLPSVVSARIVPGKSISPVKVGDTTKTIEGRLGAPAEKGCLNRQGVADCDRQMTQWSYPKRKLIVSFVAGKVADLQTTSKKQRTSKGVGPGVTRKKVLKAYKLNCNWAAAGCVIGKDAPKPGNRFTLITFQGNAFQGKRVASVMVGKYDLRDTCALGCG